MTGTHWKTAIRIADTEQGYLKIVGGEYLVFNTQKGIVRSIQLPNPRARNKRRKRAILEIERKLR